MLTVLSFTSLSYDVPSVLTKIKQKIQPGALTEFNFSSPSSILIHNIEKWSGKIFTENETFLISPSRPLINVNFTNFTMAIESTEKILFSFSVFPYGNLSQSHKCERYSIVTDSSKEYSISWNSMSNLSLHEIEECIWVSFPKKTKFSYKMDTYSLSHFEVFNETLSKDGYPLSLFKDQEIDHIVIRRKSYLIESNTFISFTPIPNQKGPLMNTYYQVGDGVNSFPANLFVPKLGINKISFEKSISLYLKSYSGIYVHNFGSANFTPTITPEDPLYESDNDTLFTITSNRETTIVFSIAQLDFCSTRYVYGKEKSGKFEASEDKLVIGTDQRFCVWIPTESSLEVDYKTELSQTIVITPELVNTKESNKLQKVTGFLLIGSGESDYYYSKVTLNFKHSKMPTHGRDYKYVYPTGSIKGEFYDHLAMFEMKANQSYHLGVSDFYLYTDGLNVKLEFYPYINNWFIESGFYRIKYPAMVVPSKDMKVLYIPFKYLNFAESHVNPISTNGNEGFLIASKGIQHYRRNQTITTKMIDSFFKYLIVIAPPDATKVSIDTKYPRNAIIKACSMKNGTVLNVAGKMEIDSPAVFMIQPIAVKNNIMLKGNGKLPATYVHNGGVVLHRWVFQSKPGKITDKGIKMISINEGTILILLSSLVGIIGMIILFKSYNNFKTRGSYDYIEEINI